MWFSSKGKDKRNSITISLDHNNKIYLEIDWLRGEKQIALNMLQSLLSGTLTSSLVNCMATMEDAEIYDIINSITNENAFNPLNVK